MVGIGKPRQQRRSEEHTSELQSHSDLPSFPTRRSSDLGYGNLRDYGLADKKAALQRLAATHPYMDLSRVGMWGHSGGGFMTAAAMLQYPDFYRAGWSESGNHDNNVDRKSTRLNSSHTVIYLLSLHDALPILVTGICGITAWQTKRRHCSGWRRRIPTWI